VVASWSSLLLQKRATADQFCSVKKEVKLEFTACATSKPPEKHLSVVNEVSILCGAFFLQYLLLTSRTLLISFTVCL